MRYKREGTQITTIHIIQSCKSCVKYVITAEETLWQYLRTMTINI